MNYKTAVTRAFCVACVLLLFCCGCTNENGVGELAELLCSDYEAEISFSLADAKNELSGKANVKKTENSVIVKFLSPEAFEGMTVSVDDNGNIGSISFSYYGISLPMPTGILTKLNLFLTAFSNETAISIASLPKREIIDCGELYPDKGNSIKSCAFKTAGGTVDSVMIFDAVKGMPCEYNACSEVYTAKIAFDSIKLVE